MVVLCPLLCIIKKLIFNNVSSFNNFVIQKCYQNETSENGVYYRYNLLKIKDGAYIINLDEYSDVGTHWVALFRIMMLLI